MDTLYWQYFLVFEEDLKNFSRYVEFSEANYHTYSIEIARIYLSVCSEIDVVAKLLSKNLGDTDPRNIGDYKKRILPTYPNLPTFEIKIERYDLTFTPWSDWNNCSPSWWQKYNDVKHHRDTHYHEANLCNLLNAMAGLLVMNLYYLKQIRSAQKSNQADILLDYEMRSILLIPHGFKRISFVNGYHAWGGDIP